MTETRTCPQCNGKGELTFLVGSDWQEYLYDLGDCALCDGTGRISSARLLRYGEEEPLREARWKKLFESKDRSNTKLKC